MGWANILAAIIGYNQLGGITLAQRKQSYKRLVVSYLCQINLCLPCVKVIQSRYLNSPNQSRFFPITLSAPLSIWRGCTFLRLPCSVTLQHKRKGFLYADALIVVNRLNGNFNCAPYFLCIFGLVSYQNKPAQFIEWIGLLKMERGKDKQYVLVYT